MQRTMDSFYSVLRRFRGQANESRPAMYSQYYNYGVIICFFPAAAVAAGSPELEPQISNSAMCSVCLGALQDAVETSCGHTFCAQCILLHWDHDRFPSHCRCPVCRTVVCTLVHIMMWEIFHLAGEALYQVPAKLCISPHSMSTGFSLKLDRVAEKPL